MKIIIKDGAGGKPQYLHIESAGTPAEQAQALRELFPDKTDDEIKVLLGCKNSIKASVTAPDGTKTTEAKTDLESVFAACLAWEKLYRGIEGEVPANLKAVVDAVTDPANPFGVRAPLAIWLEQHKEHVEAIHTGLGAVIAEKCEAQGLEATSFIDAILSHNTGTPEHDDARLGLAALTGIDALIEQEPALAEDVKAAMETATEPAQTDAAAIPATEAPTTAVTVHDAPQPHVTMSPAMNRLAGTTFDILQQNNEDIGKKAGQNARLMTELAEVLGVQKTTLQLEEA